MTRSNPRMSVTKLGEYLTSPSATRRRKILTDQKHPAEFVTTLYNDCFDPMVSFFVDPGHDPVPVQAAIRAILAHHPVTDYEVMKQGVTAEALHHLLHAGPQLPLQTLTFRRNPQRAALLHIAGVDVSIRPELEIVVTGGDDAVRYGSLKLYLGKTHPLTPEAARYVTSLVYQHAVQKYGGLRNVDMRRCYVFDVFSEQLHVAHGGQVRVRRDIQSACSDITAIWPTL